MRKIKKKSSFILLALGAALLLCGGVFARQESVALAEEPSAPCVHQPSAEGDDCSLCGEKIIAYSQGDGEEKVYYTTVDSAFSSYNEGDTVTLTSDISVESGIELSKNVTLNLNQHKIITTSTIKILSGVSFSLINCLENNPITIQNEGEVVGGVYYGGVSGDGNIYGGTFNEAVSCGGTISNGIFNGRVECTWQVLGGTFNGEVTSNASISAGTFNNTLTNSTDIDITYITFGESAKLVNTPSGKITGDSEMQPINCEVENNGQILSGNFGGQVINYGRIKNGNFSGVVIAKEQNKISGGTYAHIECDGVDNLAAVLYVNEGNEVSYAFADSADGVTIKDAYNNNTLKNVKVCEHTAHSIGVEGSCVCGLECEHVFSADKGGICKHCSMQAGARTYENTYYANIVKAVEKWKSEDPITLLKDDVIKNHLTINKNGLKINLNGFKITSYEDVIVYVDNGVSFCGNGEFDAQMHIVGDNVSISLTDKDYTPKAAGATAKYSNIVISGKQATLNGLTIDTLQVSGSANLTNCTVKNLIIKDGATVKLCGGGVQAFDVASGITFKDIIQDGYAYKSAVGKVRIEDMSAEIPVEIVKCDTHKWAGGECVYCKTVCAHASWNNGVCENCSLVCIHSGGVATCEDKPVCEICSQPYGNALGHDVEEKWTIDTPATCLEKGSRSHHCSRCDEKNYIDEIPALGHSGGTATCSQQAVCTRCTAKYGDYAKHDFGDWIAQQNATCENDGTKGHYECATCGALYGINNNKITDLTIQKLGHDYEGTFTIDTPVTCTNVGYKSKHCTRCEKTTSPTPIIPEGHKGGTANCQHGAICTVCGSEYGESNSENHVGVLTWEQKANTHREYWSCCESEIVNAGEHDWVNGACGVCLYKCPHYGGTATCIQKAVCERCGWEYGNPLGHKFQNLSTIDKVATCTESGERSHHCERCDERNGVEEIKPRGHVGGVANCAHGAICSECHEAYGELNPSKHSNLVYVAECAPTYEDDGNISYYHCEGCDKCYSDEQASQQITKAQTVVNKLITQVVQGNNVGWVWNSENGVEFKLNGLPQSLVIVYVDGEELDEHDFEFDRDSNQILLKSKYLNTLSNGAHLFGVSAGEQFVNTAFSISGAPEGLSAGAWVGIALSIVAGVSMCAFIALLFLDGTLNKQPVKTEEEKVD